MSDERLAPDGGTPAVPGPVPRRLVAPVIAFGVLACIFECILTGASMLLSPASLLFPFTFSPIVAMAITVTVTTLALCRRADSKTRAQWSVLAPALAACVVLAHLLVGILANILWVAKLLSGRLQIAIPFMIYAVLVIGICCVGGILVARWLAGQPKGCRTLTAGQERWTLFLTMVLVWGSRSAGWQVAHALHWGFWRFNRDLGPILLRDAVLDSVAILGMVVSWAILRRLFWAGADTAGRYRFLALLATWPAVDGMLRPLSVLSYHGLEQWSWGLCCGLVAGAVALIYVRMVVAPLCRKAFGGDSAASLPGAAPIAGL